jgi:nicotinamidase-related amidase
MGHRSFGQTIAFKPRAAPSSTRTCAFPTPGLLRKGIHRKIDSYSTFYENDRKTPTGLVGYLRDRGFTRVFLAGLAFDFCVRYSAEMRTASNSTWWSSRTPAEASMSTGR